MKQLSKSIAIGAALFVLGGIGCGGDDSSGPLGEVDSLIILQRTPRNDPGDIFQYTSYEPGARLIKLSPPEAGGTKTVICCDNAGAEFANADISGYDISFDAKTIVFSARLSGNDDAHYGLFLLQLEDGSVTQIMTDPGRDYVQPIFLPGDKVMFTTNALAEAGAQQFTDEYERGRTIQLGRINTDGTGEELGPRNLSHRTGPSLLSDGRVVFTQWDHLGDENSGHLMIVNQDMTELREGFGKEGKGAGNSVLKAREISAGRFVAITTARSRTLTAGALIDIRLGDVDVHDGNAVSAPNNQAEKNSRYIPLTPGVPLNGDPAAATVGRYYDAFPLNANEKPDLLVSWADGPVESAVLSAAGLTPNFGLYLYSSATQQRRPILDDPNMWDVFAQPLRTRVAPNIVASATDAKLNGQTLIGSLNVYNSSLVQLDPGTVYGVRVAEGFSSEEGFREDFGTREFEGHATLGVAPVAPDGSWSALIPANVPVHLQVVDEFGMALATEPVWFSGRAGEARMCGGCHEDRTRTTNVSPGQLDTFAFGATAMKGTVARIDRMNTNPRSAAEIIGVGWDTQVQPILDAKCVSCHGNDNAAGIASYTIADPNGGAAPVTWTFNLTGDALPAELGEAAGGGTYTKSYFSLAGPNMEAVERGNLGITGNYKVYTKPLDSRNSLVMQMLNPTVLFPAPTTRRAFPGEPHQGIELTPQEYYTVILAIDVGMNFYARENNPHVNDY